MGKARWIVVGSQTLLRPLVAVAGFAALVLLPALGSGQALMISARQMSPRSLVVTPYYQGMRGQDLTFSIASSGPCSAGGSVNPTFACGSSGNVSAEASGGLVGLQAVYQPWDSLQYYASLGASDMTLRVSSVSVTNVLTSTRPGYRYAVGIRAVLMPDTVVSPAVAIDGRIGSQRHYFSEFQPASTPGGATIDQRLDVYQYQIAVQTSHRFEFSNPRWHAEPYGGLKWLRSEAHLKDLQGGGRAGGIDDTFTPFLGVVFPLYERESLVAEGSFVGGYNFSVGLQVRL